MEKQKNKFFGFISSLMKPEFDPDCVNLGTVKLKPHQLHAVKWLLNHRGLVLYHGLGSGKTVCAVAACICYLSTYPTRRVIVITPTSLQDNFKLTLVKYIGDNQELMELANNIIFHTHTNFRLGEVDCKDALLVVDEAHGLKTAVKHSTSNVDSDASVTSGKNANAVIQCAIAAHKVLLMTATPIVNTSYDIENLIAMIEGREPYTVSHFAKIEGNYQRLRRYIHGKFSYYTPSSTELFENYPSRRNRKIVLKMSPMYHKNYLAIERDELHKLDIESSMFLEDKNLSAFYNGVRRASNTLDAEWSPKVQEIIKKIRLNPENKVLIYSHFLEAGQEVIERALKQEGIGFAHINGSMTPKARTHAMNLYNSGEVKILIISKAGGEGLDLKETNTVFILEPTWNEANLEQVIGRAIRYGSHANPTQSTVDVYYVLLLKPREYDFYLKDRSNLLGIKKTMSEALSADLYLYQ
jgi:superfamily II DNA or RNA helicase